jgi:integrase
VSDADGEAVLDFWQAQEKARKRMVERVHTAAGRAGPLTVGAAMDAYIEFLETNRKSAADARYRDQAFIRPKLGDLEVSALTADRLRKWLADLAKTPARLRTRAGEKQQYRPLDRDEDSKRRRQATANRTLTVLKAALNHAWRDKKAASNAEWHRVEPLENVDAARVRYLSVDEAKRLLNACNPDFRRLVQAPLETGARYGELVALEVADFNKDAGTVAIRRSKGGKARHVVLTEEGTSFFKEVCAGRAGRETIFLKANGGMWLKNRLLNHPIHHVRNAKPPLPTTRLPRRKAGYANLTRCTFSGSAFNAGRPRREAIRSGPWPTPASMRRSARRSESMD